MNGATPIGALGNERLAKHLGITSRQLRFAVKGTGYTGTIPWRGGMVGEALVWEPTSIRRMQVAAALAHAVPSRNGLPLKDTTAAAFEAEVPPDDGWAILVGGKVRYLDDGQLHANLEGDWPGGVVVRLPEEMWPLDPEAWTDDLPELS